MKKLLLALPLAFLCHAISAQDTDRCRAIVQTTVASINAHSVEALEEHLSPDFAIAGQKGEVAKLVLNQLFAQLGETVVDRQEVAENKGDNELVLKYAITYKKMGEKEATFVFDSNNLLKELSLFKMEVKSMTGKSDVVKTKNKVTNVPFEMAGNLIAVDVVLDGEKRKFILDSGAPKVILNAKHISKEGTAPPRSITTSKGANGTISGMDIAKIGQLDFAGIQLNDQEVITLDLSHLEEEVGYEFYGLIGFEMIKDYDILFDYEKHALTLIAPEYFATYRKESLADSKLSTTSFELKGHIPVIQAKIDDRTLNMGIDTGAETNLIDDDLFAPLDRHVRNVKTDELIGAGKDNVKEVKKGKVKAMSIGAHTFKKSTTLFSDISHLNEGYNLKLDGLIGYEVLSKQKTVLSYERKELIFIQ